MRLIDADALTKEKNIYEADLQLMVPLHIIQDAPTIEAEPVRHGRWIDGFICSCCKRAFPTNGELWNYCPNCGAKMEQENP